MYTRPVVTADSKSVWSCGVRRVKEQGKGQEKGRKEKGERSEQQQ